MSKIPAKWRKVVYVATLLIAVVGIAFGFVKPEEVSKGVEIAGQIIAAFAAALALLNISPDTTTEETQ